ncbi:MAG: hypothetical protein GX106_05755 [Candidatus Cloacimonetes bacterium]|jgi:GNAT superfamily N-acetyltransferase|nr:hypothetical protein [Candidatus Cloacimonadota bacterium]
MTNSARNTLVLVVLLILSGIYSSITLSNSEKKLREGQSKLKEVKENVVVLNRKIANREILEEEYEMQQAVAGSQFKIIMDDDSSIISYDYLLRVLNWLNKDLYYDFGLSNKAENDYNEYVISGAASYMDLVKFTRLLEYQRALITIEDLSINSQSAGVDSVGFSMIFRTYASEDGFPVSAISYNTMKKAVHEYDLFRPRYLRDAYQGMGVDSRLLDLDSAKLIAISEDRAFIRDEAGIIRMLKKGDKILYGHLQKVDSRDGFALFLINKYGFEENLILYLE